MRAGISRKGNVRPSRNHPWKGHCICPFRTLRRRIPCLETDLALVRARRPGEALACPPGGRHRHRHRAAPPERRPRLAGRRNRQAQGRDRGGGPHLVGGRKHHRARGHQDPHRPLSRTDRKLQGIDPRRRRGRHQDRLLQFHGDHRLDAHRPRLSDVARRHGAALRHRRFLRLRRAGAEDAAAPKTTIPPSASLLPASGLPR